MTELTSDESAIYEWQMWVDGFGEAGQRQLKSATVLISRCGGVGGAVADAIGTRLARTICLSATVDSTSGQETRMISTPASSQRRIWSIVATASLVGVLVMVCTVIGASPPTGTLPTMIWRL